MQDFLKLGIIGHPLTHTLSPILHAALLGMANVAGEYKPYDLVPEGLEKGLDELAGHGVRGLNVTIPHKVSVIPMLDWTSSEAKAAGAVNTIVFEEFGRHRKGYNTDIAGFVRSLPTAIVKRLPESHVLILGGGGSARAVLLGLSELKSAAVTVAVRNPEKAVPLFALLEDTPMDMTIAALDSLPSLAAFNGVINTTPLGMWPDVTVSPLERILLETLPAGGFVYDLIYRPHETPLLTDARQLGFHTQNGLDMLIHQGMASFELWHGTPLPHDLLASLRSHLMTALAHVPS